MQECYQIPGKQTVWDHGLSVKYYTWDLINHIKYQTPLRYEWKLPEFIQIHCKFLRKELNKFSKNTIDLYTLYHDCGKHICQENREGRQHFPDHAAVSARTFYSYFGSKKHHVYELIKNDMLIHTMKAADVSWVARRQEAILWIIVGLAEIHSNAELFGGINSVSFKIKWKQINQRGKSIIDKKILE